MAAASFASFEITGRDSAALRNLYRELFEWEIQDVGGDSGYGLVAAAENGIAAGIGAAPEGSPGDATFSVEVDDLSAYLERAEMLGGTTVGPPTEMEQFGLTPRPSPTPKGTSSEA